MTNTRTENNDAPLKVFRIGSVKASIWKNEADGRGYYSTKITRQYRGKDSEEWKEADSYKHAELLAVIKVAERAEAYIAKLKS